MAKSSTSPLDLGGFVAYVCGSSKNLSIMSNRITQTVAEMVTAKLMEKKQKEVSKALEEYQKAVKEAYMQSIPKPVMALWKSHPEWLGSGNGVNIHGNGFNHEYCSFAGQLPRKDGDKYERYFNPDKETAESLMAYRSKYEKLKENAKRLRGELYQGLLACVTYKKIIETFPEAKKYLPDTGLSLVLNADKIRAELKEIPTPV